MMMVTWTKLWIIIDSSDPLLKRLYFEMPYNQIEK